MLLFRILKKFKNYCIIFVTRYDFMSVYYYKYIYIWVFVINYFKIIKFTLKYQLLLYILIPKLLMFDTKIYLTIINGNRKSQ